MCICRTISLTGASNNHNVGGGGTVFGFRGALAGGAAGLGVRAAGHPTRARPLQKVKAVHEYLQKEPIRVGDEVAVKFDGEPYPGMRRRAGARARAPEVRGVHPPAPATLQAMPTDMGLCAAGRTAYTPMHGSPVKLSEQKSPRREVVRSSAGAGVIYPPFLGSFT